MRDTEELKSFIQKKLRKGYPQGELVNDLLREGYSAEEIDKAIYDSSKGNATSTGASENPVWFVITTGLGIVGISIISVNYFRYFHTLGYTLIVIGAAGIFIKFIHPFLEKNKN